MHTIQFSGDLLALFLCFAFLFFSPPLEQRVHGLNWDRFEACFFWSGFSLVVTIFPYNF